MLTTKQKKAITAKIKQEDTDGQGYLLSALGSYLRSDLNIDWRQHTTRPGQNLSSWLSEHVSSSIHTNARSAALHPLPKLPETGQPAFSPEIREKLRRVETLIEENLDSEGTIPLSHLQHLMIQNGVGSWQQLLPQGEQPGKMYLWAKRCFSPRCSVENNGNNWFLSRRKKDASGSSGAYPMEIDPEGPDSLEEVKRMQDFAYMGSASKIHPAFRLLTGYSSSSGPVWTAIIARKISNALNCPDGNYWEAPGPDGEPQAAIRMDGLTTPGGWQLFLVFVVNRTGRPPSRACFFRTMWTSSNWQRRFPR